MSTVIHQSDTLRITGNIEDDKERLIIVSFSNWKVNDGFDERETGSSFFQGHKFNSVHIASHASHWFQHREMIDVPSLVKDYTKDRVVVTYGMSMGGYAALAFSKLFSASRVVAFAPQYSIDSTKTPWETRWRRNAAAIDFVLDHMESQISPTAGISVIYDPLFALDANHIKKIRDIRPIREIKVPMGGHLVARFLGECGVLSAMVASLLRTDDLSGDFRTKVRAARSRSPAYLITVAETLRRGRPDISISIAHKAFALARAMYVSGNSIATLREVGWLLFRMGDEHGAANALDADALDTNDENLRSIARGLFENDMKNLTVEKRRLLTQ